MSITEKESTAVIPTLSTDTLRAIEDSLLDIGDRDDITSYTHEGYCFYYHRGHNGSKSGIPRPDSQEFQHAWKITQEFWDRAKIKYKLGVVSVDDITDSPGNLSIDHIRTSLGSKTKELESQGVYVAPLLRLLLENGLKEQNANDVRYCAVIESTLLPYASDIKCVDRDTVLQAGKFLTPNGTLQTNMYNVLVHPLYLRGNQQLVYKGAIEYLRDITGRSISQVQEVVIYNTEHMLRNPQGDVERMRINPKNNYALEPIRPRLARTRPFFSLG